jgi:endoglucanase
VDALGHRRCSKAVSIAAAGVCLAASVTCSEGSDSAAPAEAGAGDGAARTGVRTGLHVEGTRLVDDAGQSVFLHGVGRQGTEYRCSKYGGIFDGPSDQSSIGAMLAWHIDAVRIFLNEDCWLGINGPAAADSGDVYVAAIRDYASLLERNGITPILDLQLAAPGTTLANYPQLPMADRDHAPAFWTSVARTFGRDTAVVFDLYNEPYPDGDQDTPVAWTCWRDGGACPGLGYEAAGMQEMVDAIRGAGAENLLVAAGVRYGNVLTHWRDYQPVDPKRNLAAAWHIYDVNACRDAPCWDATVAPVMHEVPLIATEMGEFDCQDGFIQKAMTFLERSGGSYCANAWNAGAGWPCGSSDASAGPSLITDFSGTPTPYGRGYRDHIVSLP